jgi:DNA-binding transcriptional ArsR family regulator
MQDFLTGGVWMQVRGLAKVFGALSDETRLRMLKLLLNGELCVCEVVQALEIAQPRASRHLGILEDAGLLRSTRRGAWMYYAIDDAWARGPGVEILAAVAHVANDDPDVLRDLERLATSVRVSEVSGQCVPAPQKL